MFPEDFFSPYIIYKKQCLFVCLFVCSGGSQLVREALSQSEPFHESPLIPSPFVCQLGVKRELAHHSADRGQFQRVCLHTG